MSAPAGKSAARAGRPDEDRVRRVAADNPDMLHSHLAVRFGISVTRLRKIIGATGCGSETFSASEGVRFDKLGPTPSGWFERSRLRKKINKSLPGFNPAARRLP